MRQHVEVGSNFNINDEVLCIKTEGRVIFNACTSMQWRSSFAQIAQVYASDHMDGVRHAACRLHYYYYG